MRGASNSSFASVAKSSGGRRFGTRSGQVTANWIGKHMSVRAELREHRVVHELHHRMHDALRVHDHIDARHLDVEKPARFDHFQALVEERRGIDGDLRAHVPRRMLQRLRDA